MCWLNARLMHIDDLADRVSFLSAELLNVLARWAYSPEKMIPSVRTREDVQRGKPLAPFSARPAHSRSRARSRKARGSFIAPCALRVRQIARTSAIAGFLASLVLNMEPISEGTALAEIARTARCAAQPGPLQERLQH